MTSMLQSFWTGALRPLILRPPALQVAALCHRDGASGPEVLLVTSSSGRWILPKGWPIDGLTAAQAAQQEAWEEAGVTSGVLGETALGSYLAEKRFDNGAVVPCEVQVYPLRVTDIADTYPEDDRRERVWVPISKAIAMVNEDGLQQLLAQFASQKSE
ncbi:NUDIX hydrolase [Yoonia sp.]|uniref:NUDIX hydrolase n=1 Tax=Yoonia sp. TaxID=2212373 RepID=UPI003F6AB4ED